MWARTGAGNISRSWWAGRESNPHSRRRLIYSQRSSPPAQPTQVGPLACDRLAHRSTALPPTLRLCDGRTQSYSVDLHVEPPKGLEPITGGLQNRCSTKLSYGGATTKDTGKMRRPTTHQSVG